MVSFVGSGQENLVDNHHGLDERLTGVAPLEDAPDGGRLWACWAVFDGFLTSF